MISLYTQAALCGGETASGSKVEGMRSRNMAFGLASDTFTTLQHWNVGLWRTVNLEGAPVTQESWCQCEDFNHLVPSSQTCFTE